MDCSVLYDLFARFSGIDFYLRKGNFLAPILLKCLSVNVKWVVGRAIFSLQLIGIMCLSGGCKYFDPGANFIDEKKVWAKIKKEACRN